MKKILLLLIIPFLSFGQDLTYVPDDNFEQLLIYGGYDDVLDNYVLSANISTISNITFLPNAVLIDGAMAFATVPIIFDLTGIKDFTLLQDLFIPSQYLSELDVSNMAYLKNLTVNENYLTCINLTGCTSLTSLNVSGNFLTQLDVSTCISLFGFFGMDSGNPLLECVQVHDAWDLDGTGYFSTDCEYVENECNTSNITIKEYNPKNTLRKIIDILGRETINNKGFQLHIYDDGTVEKKYLIK